VEIVDQAVRDREGRSGQRFFEGVNQGCQLREPDASSRALERVEAATQLTQGVSGVSSAGKAKHQRFNALEKVGGIGQKSVANLIIQVDPTGKLGYGDGLGRCIGRLSG
jgi:hypothetical protein